MKKIIFVIVAFAMTITSMYAVDISYNTGQDQSIKKDKSMSVKNSNEQRSNNRKYRNDSDTKSYSVDVTFDTIPIYMLKANSCVKTIAVAADFGLSVVIDQDDGIIDLNKKAYLDSSANASMKISKINGARENEIKNYMACILNETAKMAQANLNLQKILGTKSFSSSDVTKAAIKEFENTNTLSDPSIRLQYIQALNSLKQPCRFLANLGHDSIQCNTLTFSFVDNSIKQAGTLLSAGSNFFGINSAIRVAISDTDTTGKEISNDSSKSSSRDATLTKTGSNSMSRGSKQQLNVSPFLPK